MEPKDIISSGILELYCLGITQAAENREVEAWAKEYPEVAAEIAAIQAGMEGYAQTHAVEPRAGVKEKLFAQISSVADTRSAMTNELPATEGKLRSISSVWKYAAAASIVLLIGSAVFNYTFYNKYKAADSDLVAARVELQQQKELAAAMHDDMSKMGDKNAMPVSLKGMPDVSDAAARIYWMQNTHEVFIDPSNLPTAPNGMQYQFWAIVDGQPVSGGMINVTQDGKTVHLQKMKSFGKAEAFAVSLEKAGPEKPAPTHVYVMGKI